MDTITPPRWPPERATSNACVHFLIDLEEAQYALAESLPVLNSLVDPLAVASILLAFAVNAVLAKESFDEDGDDADHFQMLVLTLQDFGLAKQSAHEAAQRAFDLVAKAVVESVPDFGDERYRGKYEYTLRTAVELHLSVHQSAFGVHHFRSG